MRFSGSSGLPVAARLDRLAEPDALRVVGDVLDLVGDRARVDLAQARQRVEQRLARDVEPEQLRGDPRLELRASAADEARLVERRVAHRLRAERIEPRREVAVHAVRLDERHRGRDPAEQARRRPAAGAAGLGRAAASPRRRCGGATRGRRGAATSRRRAVADVAGDAAVRPRRAGATRRGRSRGRRGSPRAAARRRRRSARCSAAAMSRVVAAARVGAPRAREAGRR